MSDHTISYRQNKYRDRRRSFRRLFTEELERRILLTSVTSVTPQNGSHNAQVSTTVAAQFNETIPTATDENFVVHSSQRGRLAGASTTVTTEGNVATHNPADAFFAGERVHATVRSGLATAGGPHVWQFRTAVAGGLGTFEDSGQALGIAANNTGSFDVKLGDLDGDGDLDALMVNFSAGATSQIFLNSNGTFTDSGQMLGPHNGRQAALGDLDGDGDLDAVIANGGNQPNAVWRNDGNAVFTQTQEFGDRTSRQVSLGDLDGDGDLDAFVANSNQADRVYLNNGGGMFSPSSVAVGDAGLGVNLGDVDGDGDLDAWVAGRYAPHHVLLNDGGGLFTDNGQGFAPRGYGLSVELGDLDGDGDLDAFVARLDRFNQVFMNDGSGSFTESGQNIGEPEVNTESHRSWDVELGDLDADGDLDAVVANGTLRGDRVYLNDGAGVFSNSGQVLPADPASSTFGIALGDVDRDGDLDVVTAHDGDLDNTLSVGRVWLNQNPSTTVTLSVDNVTIGEAAGVATFTATLSAAAAQAVTVDLSVSGTATLADDYLISNTQIVIAAGATTGSVTVTAAQDTLDEAHETVVVDIASVTNAQERGTQQATTTILDDDEPPVPDVTLSVDNAAIAEAGGVALFTATLSEVATLPVTVFLEFTGTAAASDFTAPETHINIAPGTIAGSVTVTAVDDTKDESDETVIVHIATVTNGNEDGEQQQTTTILDDDVPLSFAITSLEPFASGFQVAFSNDLDGSELNLYDTQNAGLGPADVVVTGASSGAVSGSLVIDTSSIDFIKSGGPLAADTYTVTLRSATDGFKDTASMLLDGNADGTGGDDYVSSFTIAEPPAGTRTISMPDFVRGPGQDVNLPADETTGIPITISDGDNVRAADIRIGYDPALLEIRGATAPVGGSVIVNTTTTPGVAILVFFSSTSLPAGSGTFINLQATVPAGADYGSQQVLDLHSVTVGDGNDNEFPVVVDDALHFSTYFADVSGNGRVNASDAAQVARFAALIDNGFAASLNIDPTVVGDISGNGRVNAADASLLAQFAALIDVPQIPPVPGVIAAAGDGASLQFGSLALLDRHQDPMAVTENNVEVPSAAITGGGRLPDYFAAVDTLMADRSQSAGRTIDEVLEDVMDELFSPLSSVLLRNG